MNVLDKTVCRVSIADAGGGLMMLKLKIAAVNIQMVTRACPGAKSIARRTLWKASNIHQHRKPKMPKAALRALRKRWWSLHHRPYYKERDNAK